MTSRPTVPDQYANADTVWVAGHFRISPPERPAFEAVLEHGREGWFYWGDPSPSSPLGVRPLPDDWDVEEL